jgi:hypothetical protein
MQHLLQQTKQISTNNNKNHHRLTSVKKHIHECILLNMKSTKAGSVNE